MKTKKQVFVLSLFLLFFYNSCLLILNDEFLGNNNIAHAACYDMGGGNDGHCFGDIEFVCLHSNYTWDCNSEWSKNPPELE